MLSITSLADLLPGDNWFASTEGRAVAGVFVGQTAIDEAALLRGCRAHSSGSITHVYVITRFAARTREPASVGLRALR